jgi:hypothetical protein
LLRLPSSTPSFSLEKLQAQNIHNIIYASEVRRVQSSVYFHGNFVQNLDWKFSHKSPIF